MKKYIVLTGAIILFSACKNDNPNQDEASTTIKEKKVEEVELDINSPDLNDIPALKKCYVLEGENENAELLLELEDDLVTGSLTYTGINQKSGSVIGEFIEDTLYVTYKYEKNNEKFVEELVFLEDKENFTLQQAEVDLTSDSGIQSIKDKSTLKFNKAIFKKLDCIQEN